jgi:hypothetical protein
LIHRYTSEDKGESEGEDSGENEGEDGGESEGEDSGENRNLVARVETIAERMKTRTV